MRPPQSGYMTNSNIVNHRLYNQQITNQKFNKPEQVVSWLGAVQAQDYRNSLWAIGLRAKNVVEQDIEKAIADRAIVRSWPMRGTLHFIAAEDIRWMLNLLTPQIVARAARRFKELELDEKTFTKSKKLIIKALQGGKQLSRKSIFDILEKSKIEPSNQRGIHILWKLSQEGLTCFGSHEGKQPTFALLDEWIPVSKTLHRDEALAEIAIRYFSSHGPATLQDFAWWSGLPAEAARTALKLSESHLVKNVVKEQAYFMSPNIPAGKKKQTCFLLPDYDEFMVAYKDRSASLDTKHKDFVYSGNGIFYPIIVVNGKVVGKWRREIKKDKVKIRTNLFIQLNKAQYNSIAREAEKFAKFIDKTVIPISLK